MNEIKPQNILKKENNVLKKKVKDLENLINKYELELKDIRKSFEAAASSRDLAINNEHQIRQEINTYISQIEILKKESKHLRETLDKLADLFNDTFSAFKDSSNIISIMDRNVKMVIDNTDFKLNNFNNILREDNNDN